VVLEMAEHDLVARLERGAAPAVRDQIDRLGGAAHEDDLLAPAGVQEGAHLVACRLVGIGRSRRQGVGGAMDVAVLVLVEVGQALDDLTRLLGGGRIVQPDQASPIDAFVEDGEIAAHTVEIDRRRTSTGHRDGGRPGVLDRCDSMGVRRLVAQEVIRGVCRRRHSTWWCCRGRMEMAC